MAKEPLRFPTTSIPSSPEENVVPVAVSTVPDLLAQLYNPLWEYFTQRETPKDLPDNSYEAVQDWVRAYGLDRTEVSEVIEDNIGVLQYHTEHYFIDINPFQPHPATIVIGKYVNEEGAPLGYFAFVVDHNAEQTIHGVNHKLLEEDIWIDGSVTRYLKEGDNPTDLIYGMVFDEIMNVPKATDVMLTYCIVDPIEPPNPGDGEAIPEDIAA